MTIAPARTKSPTFRLATCRPCRRVSRDTNLDEVRGHESQQQDALSDCHAYFRHKLPSPGAEGVCGESMPPLSTYLSGLHQEKFVSPISRRPPSPDTGQLLQSARRPWRRHVPSSGRWRSARPRFLRCPDLPAGCGPRTDGPDPAARRGALVSSDLPPATPRLCRPRRTRPADHVLDRSSRLKARPYPGSLRHALVRVTPRPTP
jgi:hypothetical protein